MKAGKLNLEEIAGTNLRDRIRSANLCQLMWLHCEKAAQQMLDSALNARRITHFSGWASP